MKLKLRWHLWHCLEYYRFGEIRCSRRRHFWTPYWVINLICFEIRKNTYKSNTRWVTLTQLLSLSLVFFLLVCSRHMPSIFWVHCEHMTSIWQACDKRMTSIWLAYDKPMTSIWQACDHHMTSMWQAYDKHMTSVWQAYDKRMTSTWQAYDQHMTSIMVYVRRSLGALLIFLRFFSVGSAPDWVHME